MSTMPVDPFTASAALLDLMVMSGATQTNPPTVEVQPPSDVTPRERNILEALGAKTMQAQELAEVAGYSNNSNFRNTLSNLVKRGYLKKCPEGGGYLRSPSTVMTRLSDMP